MCSIPKRTLWEILSGPERLGIRIPRIQRDYAHGRDDKAAKEVRTTLVKELIDSLKNAAEPVDLGLVFGAADRDEMTLYDGQQRFTTLFLLHWCLAWLARDTSVAEKLQRFSYNSRLHSRDFCRALTIEGLRLEPNNTKPSLRFLDATWFCPIWLTDPTGILGILSIRPAVCRHATLRRNAGPGDHQQSVGGTKYARTLDDVLHRITQQTEIPAVGDQQATGLFREEIAKVQLDVEPAHARGIKLIHQIRGGNQDARK